MASPTGRRKRSIRTQLLKEFDAVVLSGGAEQPRDLPVPGRELKGVHFAMEFLPQQNKVVAGDKVKDQIMATGKHVVVIGGGDTGSDCVGTSNRHGAKSVTQFELLPQPPAKENKELTWPYWPVKLRTSSSHEEGVERDWSVTTKRFEGDGKGNVRALVAARVEWQKDPVTGAQKMVEVPGSEFEMPPTSCCSRWGSWRRSDRCWNRSASRRTRAATPALRPRKPRTDRARTRPMCPRSLRPATCGAGRAWSCGRSAKGGSVRGQSTNS